MNEIILTIDPIGLFSALIGFLFVALVLVYEILNFKIIKLEYLLEKQNERRNKK